ncbi:unnamed protein product [Phytomonas sp. Hart1]|nr:unnamed protein product [Phytomonas sp. Hart1]|eukprot:CCW69741.1 unnamed protein product [Phytomonas sp. isolate Hart1]
MRFYGGRCRCGKTRRFLWEEPIRCRNFGCILAFLTAPDIRYRVFVEGFISHRSFRRWREHPTAAVSVLLQQSHPHGQSSLLRAPLSEEAGGVQLHLGCDGALDIVLLVDHRGVAEEGPRHGPTRRIEIVNFG